MDADRSFDWRYLVDWPGGSLDSGSLVLQFVCLFRFVLSLHTTSLMYL